MKTELRAPTLSVVMASYNGARFIRPQLDSLAAQSLRPLELVVCDDGSTDETVAIVEEFQRHAPFPVRIHRNPARLGYADNFLNGCALATGELIAFCDQDDVWEPHKLERCVAAFSEDPEILLVIHSAVVVDEALHPRGFCKPDYTQDRMLAPRGGELDFTQPGFAMVFAACLVRTIDWKNRAHDYMNADRPVMAHDQWLFFLARSLGRVGELADCLVRYRQHGGNTCGALNLNSPTPTWQRGLNEAAYRQRAEASGYYGSFLQTIAKQLPSHRRTTIHCSASHYHHQAGTYQIRAGLYRDQTTLAHRILIYAALWRRGAYRNQPRLGLGWRAALKDAGSLIFLKISSPGLAQ